MNRLRAGIVLACVVGTATVVACSAFQGSPGDGADGGASEASTDAAADVSISSDAGPILSDASWSVDAAPINLIPGIVELDGGGCFDPAPLNATTQFLDGDGGENVCVLCFGSPDSGSPEAGPLESYAQYVIKKPELAQDASYTGTLEFSTPPPSLDAAAPFGYVQLDAVGPSGLAIDESMIGTAPLMVAGSFYTASTTLTLSTSDVNSNPSFLLFRIVGDTTPNMCVAIRRPRLYYQP